MNEQLEKTIRGLECCISEKICSSPCPYKGQCDDGGYYYSKAIEDAIALLKAQESKAIEEPLVVGGHLMGKCPRCARVLSIIDYPNFCGHCGQAVKWE